MEIRRSHDRLISTRGFPILVRWHLYIESGPCYLHVCPCSYKMLRLVGGISLQRDSKLHKGTFTQGAVLVQCCGSRCGTMAPSVGSSWFQQASLHWRTAVWQDVANWVPKPIYSAAVPVLELKGLADSWQPCRCHSQTQHLCVRSQVTMTPRGGAVMRSAATKWRPV